MWSMDSNSSLHKAHLLTNIQPLFWSWSKVNTLPQQALPVKKLTLEGIQEFQIISNGKGMAQFESKRVDVTKGDFWHLPHSLVLHLFVPLLSYFGLFYFLTPFSLFSLKRKSPPHFFYFLFFSVKFSPFLRQLQLRGIGSTNIQLVVVINGAWTKLTH